MDWTVNQTGSGNAISIEQGFAGLEGSSVSYGWTEESANYSDGTDIITVAAVHQFGSDRVPARPILTTSFERNAEAVSYTHLTLPTIPLV